MNKELEERTRGIRYIELPSPGSAARFCQPQVPAPKVQDMMNKSTEPLDGQGAGGAGSKADKPYQ